MSAFKLEFKDDNQDELQHYGVLGMKWGIRKDPKRAHEKATSKLEKLDRRAEKLAERASRNEANSVNRQRIADSAHLFRRSKARRAERAIQRSERSRQRYIAQTEKAMTWYKQVENAFRDVKLTNVNQRYVELGKKYSQTYLQDLMANAQTSNANKQLLMYYNRRANR